MDGGGFEVPTAQAIAALVFLVGTIGVLLKIIQSLYADANAKLEDRIAKLEAREAARDEAGKRYMDSMERALELATRSTGVAEEVVRKTPVRRPRAGDE